MHAQNAHLKIALLYGGLFLHLVRSTNLQAFTVMFTGPRQSQKGNGQSKPDSLVTFFGTVQLR